MLTLFNREHVILICFNQHQLGVHQQTCDLISQCRISTKMDTQPARMTFKLDFQPLDFNHQTKGCLTITIVDFTSKVLSLHQNLDVKFETFLHLRLCSEMGITWGSSWLKIIFYDRLRDPSATGDTITQHTHRGFATSSQILPLF